jgi:hypothetical protein
MFSSKLKIAAVPLLLVATVGAAATLGFQTSRQRKNAWQGPGNPATPVEQVFPTFAYTETTPVGAEVPAPDEYAFSVPLQCVLYQLPYLDDDVDLPKGAVVLTDPPYERRPLARAYTEAHDQGREGEVAVPAGSGLSILTAGPLLRPHEHLAVRHLSRQGRRIDLQVAHAPNPGAPGERPEGPSWRPLLLVPLLLPEGSYELTATWQAFATPPPATRLEDGKPLDQPPLTFAYRFRVPDGLAESTVLRAGGADFQTLADGRWRAPTPDRRRAVHLGLRVANRGDKGLLLDPRGLSLSAWNLRGADRPSLPFGGGNDHTIPAKPVPLPPGRSHLFVVRAALDSLGLSGPLRLSGSIGSGDTYWSYQGLVPGRYDLTFDYGASPQPLLRDEAYWTGRVISGAVRVEVVP